MQNKNFQNPHICEKLVDFMNLEEFGSNYRKDLFDPNEFGPDSHFRQLAKSQQIFMEKKRTFVPGIV